MAHQQDFVKFGKRDVYERSKKLLLEGFWGHAKMGPFCTFAEDEQSSPQYIYMVPVEDYGGLGDFMRKKGEYDRSVGKSVLLPFLSTLNFTMESLHRYLPMGSYLPQGRESILSYGAAYFYLFGVTPAGEGDFEAHLERIAAQQEGAELQVCFRSWKVVMGADTPKYLVAVFGATGKDAELQAKGLNLGQGPVKNILRSQKEGSAVLRKDLSTAVFRVPGAG